MLALLARARHVHLLNAALSLPVHRTPAGKDSTQNEFNLQRIVFQGTLI